MPGLMIFSATLRRTGCGLLGHEDDAHAAFADLLQQLVRADRPCRGLRAIGDVGGRPSRAAAGRLQEAAGLARGPRSSASTSARRAGVAAAGLLQVGGPLARRRAISTASPKIDSRRSGCRGS